MPDGYGKIYSASGKRRILIADDEAINREILGTMLEDQYEIIFAASGPEAIEIARIYKDTLSLVILDLLMPDMHGLEVLQKLKEDPELQRLPVIVMTADRSAEVESLTLGAIDFIPKPYPEAKVVQARVRRTIELSEDRDIIRWTERDQLTGLYNREFFYRYADQFDLHNKDLSMDAIVVDVNHFHMINERYGKAYGDEVLRRVAEKVSEIVQEGGGIVCRREADTFLIYCPHRSDYTSILENASVGLSGDESSNSRVRLRMGVYSDVDKTIDIERRFDRAKLAADTVRSNFTKAIAIYDNALHETEIFAEQLLEDFHRALEEHQFTVFYQPKFDIRPAQPFLNSAEALVRWKHPELGMISPGVFIPLFERNGLIQELDSYVWREAARQMQEWKERLGVRVPVSVNVSRIDMYEPRLVEDIVSLTEEYGIQPEEFLLEITESAYTQDSEQIIATVNRLREKGFKVEMDDFGTGYSSLNMISTLPIDALKLDIQFIRNAFSERKDTRMLEVVIDIADSLNVPTIAEGVETAEQTFTLRSMGCAIVQGYYFSRPVPAAEYEQFLLDRQRHDQEMEVRRHMAEQNGENAGTAESSTESRTDAADGRTGRRRRRMEAAEQSAARGYQTGDRFTYDALHDPLTGMYNHTAFEMLLHDADQGHIALLIADVDNYDRVVSKHGSSTADEVILRVADVLRQSFRSVDYICRIQKDEFAIIMTRVNSSMRKLVFDKIDQINDILSDPEDGLPPVALSVGVAFSDRENPQGNILQDADTALFRMKEVKRCGCAVF